MTQAANARRKRRGQVALEYLTTYGFALLAMLLTIGAISYLGFFNPNVLRANECSFPSGIGCEDYQISDGSGPAVEVILSNQYGVNITVTTLTTEMELDPGQPGTYACADPLPGGIWAIGTNKTFTCSFNALEYASGQRYDATLVFNFTQQGGTYEHQIRGVISTTAK
jgi:hypothetical protein